MNSFLGTLSGIVMIMLGGFATQALAAAGDPLPVAPLSDVTPGKICEARTVMKGTAISSFDVEIIEVAGFGDLAFGKLIYFRIVDPDVAAIGVAGGMSGSPILCSFGGQDRVIGAISYGLAGSGPKGFATPIEDVLAGQPSPASYPARSGENLPLYRGRKLVEQSPTLSVTGVPHAARKNFRESLRRRGVGPVVFAAPAPVDVPVGSPDLAPGGAFSMNYSYGDITIGGICTITYRDGNDLWGCGHPIDLAGQRSISLSGAYIFDVLGTPGGFVDPYKFGAGTETQVGAILYDGPFAVSGRLGRQVPSTPVKLTLNADGGSATLESHVVAEDHLPGGSPDGFSYTAPIAVAMADRAQFRRAGQPTIQNGRVCMKQTITGYARQVASCTRFASSAPSWSSDPDWGYYTGAAQPAAFFVGSIGTLLAHVSYRALYPGPLEMTVDIRTGSALRQILDVRPLGKLRAGRRARLRVIIADRNGKRYRRILRFRIPKRAVPNRRKKAARRHRKKVSAKVIKFRVESGALYESDPEFGMYFATRNDGSMHRRLEEHFYWDGETIRSARKLNQEIHGLFHKRATLNLQVPWRKQKLRFPLGGGGDIVVGDASRRMRVAPARGRRSPRRAVR